MISTDKGEIRIRHFTHAVDMAIVTEVTPSEGEKGCFWTWHPTEAKTTRPGYPGDEAGLAAFAKRYGALGNLPWALHNAWWQYRYSMDDDMLREKIYPLLRRAIRIYLRMMRKS